MTSVGMKEMESLVIAKAKNYVTSYLSGTVRLKFDKAKALITLSVKHSENHNIEEHWEKYFDIK